VLTRARGAGILAVMQPRLFTAPPVWSVTQLNRYLRQLLESDYQLQDIWVAGEVSNLARPASGHLYFTLKDGGASVRCVMWREDVGRLVAVPRDGQAIEVHGRISQYEAGGQTQLYADSLRQAGEGELYQTFLRLKARLEAEGLFDPERKRPLPPWPKKIGVVTSPAAAALRDVVQVLRRRYPLVEAVLSPTPVQGEEAAHEACLALERLNRFSHPDVILLVRGGGSIEDLWAFNDESLARAIVASDAPVVSGIGHETDLVIADLAADRRAATPSAAAEIVTPDREDLAQELQLLAARLKRAFHEHLQQQRNMLTASQLGLRISSPRARLANARQRLDELGHRAALAVGHSLRLRTEGLARLDRTLQAVGPQAVLARGYAVVTRAADAAVLRSISQITPGLHIRVRLSDGSFAAQASGVGRSGAHGDRSRPKEGRQR
jgi:exodeoxyribonuclease VII large subunit